MKKLLLSFLGLIFIATVPGWLPKAVAQCTGVFPSNTLCGNLTGSPQPPAAFSAAGTVAGPGSTTSGNVVIWGNSLGTSLSNSGTPLASVATLPTPGTSSTIVVFANGTTSLATGGVIVASNSAMYNNDGRAIYYVTNTSATTPTYLQNRWGNQINCGATNTSCVQEVFNTLSTSAPRGIYFYGFGKTSNYNAGSGAGLTGAAVNIPPSEDFTISLDSVIFSNNVNPITFDSTEVTNFDWRGGEAGSVVFAPTTGTPHDNLKQIGQSQFRFASLDGGIHFTWGAGQTGGFGANTLTVQELNCTGQTGHNCFNVDSIPAGDNFNGNIITLPFIHDDNGVVSTFVQLGTARPVGGQFAADNIYQIGISPASSHTSGTGIDSFEDHDLITFFTTGTLSAPVVFELGSVGNILLNISDSSVTDFSGGTNTIISGTKISTGRVMLGSTTVVSGVAGDLGFAKISASGTAPGAGSAKLEVTAGTSAGTCKLIMYAGTSTAALTIIDNVGSGC